MTPKSISVYKLTSALICLCIVIGLLYVGRSFFIPLTYGVFFAFMLKPICDRIERVVKNRVAAIILTMLTVGLVIGGVLSFFFFQIVEVVQEAENITHKLQTAGSKVLSYCGGLLGLNLREATAIIEGQVGDSIAQPMGILTSGLSTSGTLIANFTLIIIYIFFFLLYSTALRQFVQGQLSDEAKREGEQTLREIQHVAADYLGGMLTVMLVLGVLNSLGLYLIGIKYALVWGFLGALLAVIPYVGTTVGGLLPLLYAIATTGSLWQPLSVIILYVVVQFVEGNFITPKIVGNSVKINALAAILSIILGALIWGLAGIILAIPLLAMVRIILDHIVPFKPVALLLSDDLYDQSDKYLEEFDQPKYRLSSLFIKRNKVVLKTDRQVPDEVSKSNPQIISDTEAQQ